MMKSLALVLALGSLSAFAASPVEECVVEVQKSAFIEAARQADLQVQPEELSRVMETFIKAVNKAAKEYCGKVKL